MEALPILLLLLGPLRRGQGDGYGNHGQILRNCVGQPDRQAWALLPALLASLTSTTCAESLSAAVCIDFPRALECLLWWGICQQKGSPGFEGDLSLPRACLGWLSLCVSELFFQGQVARWLACFYVLGSFLRELLRSGVLAKAWSCDTGLLRLWELKSAWSKGMFAEADRDEGSFRPSVLLISSVRICTQQTCIYSSSLLFLWFGKFSASVPRWHHSSQGSLVVSHRS